MPKFILSILLLILNCSLSMANECQIKSIDVKPTSNDFIFQNKVDQDFDVFTKIPIRTVVHDSPILLFNGGKYIGFQKIGESFYTQDTIEESFDNKWKFLCKNKVLEFKKNNHEILLAKDRATLDGLEVATVFIIPDKQKDTGYFHILSFAGFDEQDVIQMLIKNK